MIDDYDEISILQEKKLNSNCMYINSASGKHPLNCWRIRGFCYLLCAWGVHFLAYKSRKLCL